MSAALLFTCRARGIELWAESGIVRYDAPAGTMTAELMQQLRRHKPELLRLLTLATDAHGRPVEPCRACGRGAFYRSPTATAWSCRTCQPPVRIGAGYCLLTLAPTGETHDG